MKKLDRFIKEMIFEIEQNLPVFCPVCKSWVRRKNTIEVLHRVSGYVTICNDCYDDIYGMSFQKDK